MGKMSPVVHFEMGYNDKDRMVKFYETVFGWKGQQMGPEMGGYVVAQTTDTDEGGMVTTPGTINGGFYKKEGPSSQAPSVVISVDFYRRHRRQPRQHTAAQPPRLVYFLRGGYV
jgi:predicted enzyme related to lactoylglutathione lyase